MTIFRQIDDGANIAPIFAALGEEHRLLLVSKLLSEPDLSITELSTGFSQTRQGVTRHIRVLEDVGIVIGKKSGREMRYRLEVSQLKRASEYLKCAAQQWDEAITRLSTYLEENP